MAVSVAYIDAVHAARSCYLGIFTSSFLLRTKAKVTARVLLMNQNSFYSDYSEEEACG